MFRRLGVLLWFGVLMLDAGDAGEDRLAGRKGGLVRNYNSVDDQQPPVEQLDKQLPSAVRKSKRSQKKTSGGAALALSLWVKEESLSRRKRNGNPPPVDAARADAAHAPADATPVGASNDVSASVPKERKRRKPRKPSSKKAVGGDDAISVVGEAPSVSLQIKEEGLANVRRRKTPPTGNLSKEVDISTGAVPVVATRTNPKEPPPGNPPKEVDVSTGDAANAPKVIASTRKRVERCSCVCYSQEEGSQESQGATHRQFTERS